MSDRQIMLESKICTPRLKDSAGLSDHSVEATPTKPNSKIGQPFINAASEYSIR
jgi:hypothetical protein